jgi:hypothetical protein
VDNQKLAISLLVVVACWCLETIGPLQTVISGLLNLHGRLYPLPLRLACCAAYASSASLPRHLQGCILGLWLAVTKTGFPPARLRDIALPQPKLDPSTADRHQSIVSDPIVSLLALGIKVVFMGLALFGNATMWLAVFADMGASLLVVFNGLRLLRSSEPSGQSVH